MQNELLTMSLTELKERVMLAERLALATTIAANYPASGLPQPTAATATEAAGSTATKTSASADAPKTETKTRKVKENTTAPDSKEPETPKTEAKGGATEEDQRQTVSDLIAKIRTDFSNKGVDAVRKLVSEYGYEKSKDVHPEQLTDFINDLNLAHSALGKAGEAGADMDSDV